MQCEPVSESVWLHFTLKVEQICKYYHNTNLSFLGWRKSAEDIEQAEASA